MSGAPSIGIPPPGASTIRGARVTPSSVEPMDYAILDKISPDISKLNYMQSIGVNKRVTRRSRAGLASLQLIKKNRLVFYTQFTMSQVKRVSEDSWKIIKINEEIIEAYLYALQRGYPGSIGRVVIHDTREFFDIGELEESKRRSGNSDQYTLWIHPREQPENDVLEDVYPYSWLNGKPVNETSIPGTPESPFIVWSLVDKHKGFWSDKSDPILRSMLRPTCEMDTRTAYEVLSRIALTGKEIGSFEEYFRINPLKSLEVIGVGGFGIAIAVKDAKGFVSVLKLIPLNDEKVIDLLREVFITAQLSNYKPIKGEAWKFPAYYGCAVVKGGLSREIQSLLEVFQESESFMQPNLTKWLAINLEYGGNPLRQYAKAPEGHLQLEHYGCALSILVQVINTLAEAENARYFEHRDCHWENILIFEHESRDWDFMKIDSDTVEASLRTFGISVMLIDFGLARCNVPHGVEYIDVSQKSPEILQQSGTVQYEVYKKMHKIIGEDWCRWRPETNAVWIEYLVDKLLHRVAYKFDNTTQYSAYKSFIEKFQQALHGNKGQRYAKEYRHLLCRLLLKEKLKTTSRN